jgi:hypothetical protein
LKEFAMLVLNELPASDFRPGRSVKVQRKPAGKSLSKSYDQFRLSIHRAAPRAGQSIKKGAVVSRGSPSATIGSENRAVTWRTCLTVPTGEKRASVGAASPAPDDGAASVANASAASVKKKMRPHR